MSSFSPQRPGQVQKPARGHVIDAQEVGSEGADQLEIARRLGAFGEWLAGAVGAERPVGHAFGVKLRLAQAKELPAHGRA